MKRTSAKQTFFEMRQLLENRHVSVTATRSRERVMNAYVESNTWMMWKQTDDLPFWISKFSHPNFKNQGHEIHACVCICTGVHVCVYDYGCMCDLVHVDTSMCISTEKLSEEHGRIFVVTKRWYVRMYTYVQIFSIYAFVCCARMYYLRIFITAHVNQPSKQENSMRAFV
jgi:hypothetical protein